MAISLEEFATALDRCHDMTLSLGESPQERGRIVYLSVHLETQLRTILLAFATERRSMEDFLGRSGSSFNSRIELCHALGLISDSEKRDLDLFRKIRNKLAHNLDVSSNDPQITAWAKELSLPKFTQKDIEKQPAIKGMNEEFENAGPILRIEYYLAFFSQSLALRIDAAQDLGKALAEGSPL